MLHCSSAPQVVIMGSAEYPGQRADRYWETRSAQANGVSPVISCITGTVQVSYDQYWTNCGYRIFRVFRRLKGLNHKK